MSREETVAFLRRCCSTYFHPVGTCAMGSGREAVVDAELRVHGMDGLRVADASIMPTITSANTNAPAVMIGEFAAQLIVAGGAGAGPSVPLLGEASTQRCHRDVAGEVLAKGE
jgi:choline dehydrogenase